MAGLSTIVMSFFQPSRRGHDLLGAATQRHRRVVGVQGQPHAGLLGHGHHRLQEVGDVGPHLLEGVGPHLGERGHVLAQGVVVPGHAGAAPAEHLVVALHQPVGVEVVLDHREADLARGPDRLVELVDLLVAPRPTIERVREAPDHHVGDGEPVLLEPPHQLAEPLLRPRHRTAPHEDVLDSDLLELPHLLRIGVGADAEAELRHTLALGRRPAPGARRRPRRQRRQGRRDGQRPRALQEDSSGSCSSHEAPSFHVGSA